MQGWQLMTGYAEPSDTPCQREKFHGRVSGMRVGGTGRGACGAVNEAVADGK